MRSSKITMNYWKSISQENQSAGKNLRGRNSSGFKTPPCSQSIMAAPKWPWHSTVDGCGDRAVPTDWGTGGAALCGSVFKVEYTDCGQRRVYLRLYSGTLRLRDTVALAGREKLKITEMRIPSKGEIVRTDTAYQGEIVILPSDSVRLNDVLGDQTRLPVKGGARTLPMLRTTIAPKTAAQRERLLDALTQLADTDPLFALRSGFHHP